MEQTHDPRGLFASPRPLVIVSPCRDEAETIERTIASMEAQTVQPTRWVIVDDGSTDDTPRILEDAAKRIPWLQIIRRENRGYRKVGGGVIEAFDVGRESIDCPYDYIAKLDMDLEFGPRYLERALELFATDPKLAALSGQIFMRRNGQIIEEFSMIPEAVAGCFKLYRREALDEIGGFVKAVMWDGIDIHQCRMRNLETKNLPDADLQIIHLRPMGASDRSIWRGRLRWGAGQWFMGSAFLYTIASGVHRMRERPFLIGGLLIIVGYVAAALRGHPRYEDKPFRRSLRKWQRRRLLETVGLRSKSAPSD